MRIYKHWPRRIEEEFLTLEKEVQADLKNIDPDYSSLLDEIDIHEKSYPFLLAYLEGTYDRALTQEEQDAWQTYKNLLRWKDIRERRQLYFLGHGDALAYLKKIWIS